MSRRRALSPVCLAGLPAPMAGQGGGAEAATRQMSHHSHDSETNPHLRLSTARLRTAEDSSRGHGLVTTIRRELAKYRDVKVAIAYGYEPFLPNVSLPVYHFTNKHSGLEAAFSFDAAKPTSLLYRKNSDGTLALTGVMYTAPALLGEESRWRETRAGKPLFGPESPIASAEECDINAFESGDPAVIWSHQ